jgi:hypothetical protein
VALELVVQSVPTLMKKTVNGWNCKATLIAPSTSEEFLNVEKSVPTTTDQLTSLVGPGPSMEHTVGEEEKMEETPPPHQDAIMTLSVLDTVECASDMNDIMKAVDELQDFVSKVHTNGFKQSSSNSCLRNNDNKHQFKFDKSQ